MPRLREGEGMKAVITIIAALLLAGCDPNEQGPAEIQPAEGGQSLERFGPDEFGVVCYRRKGYEGISCVKVANTIPLEEKNR